MIVDKTNGIFDPYDPLFGSSGAFAPYATQLDTPLLTLNLRQRSSKAEGEPLL